YASINAITPGYLETVGLPLLRGRAITDADDEHASRVSLVNEAAARALWPKQDPIGKRWRFGASDTAGWLTRVGVVANARQNMEQEEQQLGEVLRPYAQMPPQPPTGALRTAGDPGALAATVRRTLHDRDPNLPFYDVRTLNENFRMAIWEPRLYAKL